jgi:hypothetical protein
MGYQHLFPIGDTERSRTANQIKREIGPVSTIWSRRVNNAGLAMRKVFSRSQKTTVNGEPMTAAR